VLAEWCSGQRVVRDQRSYSTPGPVSAGMGDCLRVDKPSRYVTNHRGQLSPASLRGMWVLACLAGVKARRVHLCRIAGNTVWSHMASDAHSSEVYQRRPICFQDSLIHHHHHHHHKSWAQCPLTSDACFAIFCQSVASVPVLSGSSVPADFHRTAPQYRLVQFLLLARYVPNVAERSVWEQSIILRTDRPTDPPTDRPCIL